MAIETQPRVTSPEEEPKKNKKGLMAVGGAVLVAAGVFAGTLISRENAEAPPQNLEEMFELVDEAFVDAGVDPNTLEPVDSAENSGNADAKVPAVENEESIGPESVFVRGIELPNYLQLERGDNIEGALIRTTGKLLEESLKNSDSEFLSMTAFNDGVLGSDSLYSRFANFEGASDVEFQVFIDGENRPELIEQNVQAGFAKLTNGDILAGFRLEVQDPEGDILDSQWVIAQYSQNGANESLGWGLAFIELLESPQP